MVPRRVDQRVWREGAPNPLVNLWGFGRRARTLRDMGDADQAVLPTGGDDADLAAKIAAGDQQALAALYDRYSDRIYSYCVSICRNPENAADAMQDTFLLAFARIGQLRDQSKLRPWLYAIARNECLRQIRATKRTVDIEFAGEVADMNATSDTALNAADARALIDDAFEGMNSTDREVLDLALRQDLDNSAIAAVLGVSDNNAAAKVSRAKSQLEKSVGALLLFRSRASGCSRLDKEIGTDSAYTPLARKRISRHAQDCAECSKSRSKSVAAIALVGLPVLIAPSWLRDSLLNSVVPQTAPGTLAAQADPAPDVAQGSDSGMQSVSADVDGSESSEASWADAGTSQDAGSIGSGGHSEVSDSPAAHDQVAVSTPGSDGPVFIAMSNSKVPPLPLKDKAAQLAKVRPPFDKQGWPIAGQHKPKRWPLIAGIAAVLVLMAVATGLALTSGEAEPVVAESTNSTAPIVAPTTAPSVVPAPTPDKAKKSAPTDSADTNNSQGGANASGSGSQGGSTAKPKPKPTAKPKPKPTTPAPAPTPTPTPGGPGGSNPIPGGPGGIAAPPDPIPG